MTGRASYRITRQITSGSVLVYKSYSGDVRVFSNILIFYILKILKGGISDPRNKALMKMFNLIGIGERAGSGVPDIYSVWEQQGWKQPEVAEEYGPDRTILKLSFVKSMSDKTLIKSADKKTLIKDVDKKKLTNKTRQQLEKIIECMEPDREYRIAEIAEFLGVKETRTRELVRELIQLKKIEASGKNKGRRYRKIVQ